MSDRCFVDTNILVYAHDRSAGSKHQQAARLVGDLWDSGDGVVSTQVLQELCASLRRKIARPLAAEEVRQIVSDYATWQLVVNTAESILYALEIEAKYKISFWDALVVQAADDAGAAVLYSEDLARGQKYGPVRVVNPFLPAG
jgi:predicted nucleic acid-binding protein